MRRWVLVRDILLVMGGMSGAGYSLVVNPDIGAQWLVLFSGMMGVPFVLAGDRKRNGESGE